MTRRALRSALLVRHLGAWRADGGGPGYRQLADRIRLLVLDGRLPLETALPGERELAAALDVSRTLVAGAYGLLRDEGFLTSRPGSGARTALPAGPAPRGPALVSSGEAEDGLIDMTAAVLPAGAEVHAAYARALERLPLALPGHGYEPVGAMGLRAALAERYGRAGLPTTPDQILVTHGAQNALAHILRWRTRPGDRVVIEQPTYPHAIDAVQAALCKPVPVPVTSEGWAIDELADRIARSEARLAYLVADHHNPTGLMMPAADRARLVDATRRGDSLLIFDETLADLWLDAPPPAEEPVDGPHVLRIGSAAKSFWGGLRVGWIRGDAALIAALSQARAALDLGVAVLEQLATAELIATGEGALAARRAMLRARRDALLDLVATHLPDWDAPRPPGGLSLWARLPGAFSSSLASAATRQGVRIPAGPRFGLDGTLERFIRLPFTQPEARLEAAVRGLAVASAEVAGTAARRAPERRPEPVF